MRDVGINNGINSYSRHAQEEQDAEKEEGKTKDNLKTVTTSR